MLVQFERLPRVGSMFDELLRFDKNVDDLLPVVLGVPAWRESPSADFFENEKESVVVVELPGVSKEDLKITLHEGILTLSGERKKKPVEGSVKRVLHEAPEGKFKKSFLLRHEVRPDGVSAELSNGILKVVVPKAESALPKQINIHQVG